MKYYSTQRPVGPGTYFQTPFHKVLEVVNFDERTYCEEIGRMAWGYLIYDHPISPEDAADYELVPELDKIIPVKFAGVDASRAEVYVDEKGNYWKFTEPGEAPRERHERLNRAAGNELDGEPGRPMDPEFDYRIVRTFGASPCH